MRLRCRDDLARLRLGERSRIGELLQVLPIRLEILDVRLRRNEHDHHVASLFGLAGHQRLDPPGQRFFELSKIALLVRRIRQLLWRADVVAENVLRLRDAFPDRQVIDERRQELGLCRPLFD